MRKLFVVTSGTVAATVGKELLRQVTEHSDGELNIMVRYLDIADLKQRLEVHDGEWRQMQIAPGYMKVLYEALKKNRTSNSRVQKMLFDGLLPKTTGVGGGRIRYNGAGAATMNYDNLKKWLGSNMADLVRSGDKKVDISTALIVSSVGATGSGSAEHIANLIADVAESLGIKLPIRCDIFILQPSLEGVNDLGLANTLALYAELAASRLSQDGTDFKRYQGRIMMVGWGSDIRLISIDQLRETTATLVRLLNDPVTKFVAEFQEREADNHVLLQLDPLTHLPSHLSSATAVSIGLGSLKEQIIEHDAALLVDNLVHGKPSIDRAIDIMLGTLAGSMQGHSPKERYEQLLKYISSDVEASLRTKKPKVREGILNNPIQNHGNLLRNYRDDDKRKVDQSVPDMKTKGNKLVEEITQSWQEQQRSGVKTLSLSLESIRDEYRKLHTELVAMLNEARQDRTTADENDANVEQRITDLDRALQGRRKPKDKDRQSAVGSAIMMTQTYLTLYLRQKTNPIVLAVLEALRNNCGEVLQNLEAVLQRLERQHAIIKPRSLSLTADHPLELPALLEEIENDEQQSEVYRYYQQVSIFSSRTKKIGEITSAREIEREQLAEFRRRLNHAQLEDLFRGDLNLVLEVARRYTYKQVSEEVEKHSVLEVLLEHGNETALQERLREAAELALPLVTFNSSFAPKCEEVWHVSAYCENDAQRSILQRAILAAFGQGRCTLIPTKDPTEIVVFYYVDGLPMSAIQDLTGRCLDTFLERRKEWLNREQNTTQDVWIPLYSGKDAEERVIQHRIICKLCQNIGKDFSDYRDLPELKDCEF
jgi:hypothetical protein